MPINFYQYNDLATQKYNIHQAQQKKTGLNNWKVSCTHMDIFYLPGTIWLNTFKMIACCTILRGQTYHWFEGCNGFVIVCTKRL